MFPLTDQKLITIELEADQVASLVGMLRVAVLNLPAPSDAENPMLEAMHHMIGKLLEAPRVGLREPGAPVMLEALKWFAITYGLLSLVQIVWTAAHAWRGWRKLLRGARSPKIPSS